FPRLKPSYTVENYLEIDRADEERYEYLDGEIYLMAGESGAHGDICTNLVGEIRAQLKGSPCRARSKDTKVRSRGIIRPSVTTKGMFSYPDLLVICGAPQYHDEVQDMILNPAVIAEVLSESTERFDRGEKFERYRLWNPTLADYLLVSQDKPLVEHFTRQSDGNWLLREYRGLNTSLIVESISCNLSLAEIFDRVEFQNDFDEEIVG
ncbi:MAG: Uma2 family endonuclease, partial [Pyrinomonadaceae bacterium]